MNGEQQAQGERVVYERCMCRQMLEWVGQMTGLTNEQAQQHFRNSRVEMLKGLRAIIDGRIERLSRSGQQGASIKVE
jgi:ABC-type Na+ transport system ATPase subunit NatA